MAARDIQFIVRARDEASRAFDNIAGALQELLGAQNAMAASGGKVNANLSEIIQTLGRFDQVSKTIFASSDRATTAFDQQAAKVDALEKKLGNLKQQASNAGNALSQIKSAAAATGGTADAAQVKAVEAAQKDLQRQVQRTSRDLANERATMENLRNEAQKLASLANATEAAAPGVANAQSQAEAAQAMEAQAAAAERIRNELNPTLAIQKRYAAEIQKIRENTLLTDHERLAAEKLLNAEMKREIASAGHGERGRPTLFGLKPYELTNLGYQVNDIVSGLASGQNIMQILAQQGGQVLQLFPRLGSTVVAALTNPAILAAAATFGLIAAAIKGAADQAQRLREIGAILRLNADGANYSADAIERNIEDMKQFGLTAAEATTIVKTLIKEGVNPDYFDRFGESAKDMSRVLGTDVKDAAQQAAEAFTGGYDAIVKLDEATNFLSAAEREHIRVLFDSGRAADARSEAFDKFHKKMDDAAQLQRGEWSKAVERLDQSWEHFKDGVADSEWANIALKVLNSLAVVIEKIADDLERANAAREQFNAANGGGFSGSENAGGGGGGGGFGDSNDGTDPRNADKASKTAQNEAKEQARLQQQLLNATTDYQRIRVAGEQAYREELRKTGDEAVAQIKRTAAEQAETTRIQIERRKELLSTAEGFLGRRENNRQDAAVLQALFKQYGVKMPENIPLDRDKAAWCAAFVNAILGSKGIKGTGSLAASSFKTFGSGVNLNDAQQGDIVVLKPQARGSSGHVGFFEGFAPNGDVRLLGGNQGKSGQGAVSVATFGRNQVAAVRRVGSIGEGVQGLDSETQKQIEIAQAQSDFNHQLDVEAAKRALVIKYMQEQLGMSAEQLFDSKKKQAVDEAILDKQAEAKDKNIEFTKAQEDALRQQLGAQYEAEHAEEKINAVLSEQQSLRDALLKGLQEAEDHGDTATVEQLKKAIEDAQPALEKAIDEAIKFWSQFDSPEAKAALENLRQLKREVDETGASIAKIEIGGTMRRIGALTNLRSELQQREGDLEGMGDLRGAAELNDQIQEIDANLRTAYDDVIQFWEGVQQGAHGGAQAFGMTNEELEALIANLKNAKFNAQDWGTVFGVNARNIADAFANDLANAFDTFAQSVAKGEGVFKSLGRAFLQFAADFMREIAMMIIKAIAFKLAMAALGAAGVPVPTAHAGGIAGSTGGHKTVSPGAFTGALRMHTGGIAGIRPDEVPTILKKGEEVLTEQNPRHIKNARSGKGGGRGASGMNLKQILVMSEDELVAALADSQGFDDVFVTKITRNSRKIKQILE